MPTDSSPPWPAPNAPRPPLPSLWRSWQSISRWKRWVVYGVAVTVGLGAVGAATANDDTPSASEPSASTSLPATTSEIATTTAPAPSTTTPATVPASIPPGAAPLPTEPPPDEPATTEPTQPPPRPSHPPRPLPRRPIPGSALALDVLAMIPVQLEHPAGYDRDRFHYGDTTDDHGCRTRALVLKRDSLTPAQVDAGACTVVAGDWYSRYDGVTWTDPAEVEIDHVVALKEAWDSGAWAWDDARLTAYGNDVDDARTLVAVTGSENTAKSDKDPSNWIPPNADAVCTYLADWTAIKARWGLSMDESEYGRIRNLLTDRCPGQTIAPWDPVPVAAPPATLPVAAPAPTPPPPTAAVPLPAPPVVAPPAGNCDPSYPTLCIPVGSPDLDCGDIPDRRFPVVPPDPHRFDGDHDGVGCES